MIGQKDFIEAVERSICGRHLCDEAELFMSSSYCMLLL